MNLPNDFPDHDQASVSLKFLLLVFALVLIGALGYFVWQQNNSTDTTRYSSPSVSEQSQANPIEEQKVCDFDNVQVTLKPATTYDLGGGEEFDALVCGYLTTKQQNMAFEGDPPLLKNRAYLNVTKFADSKFKAALDKQINEGNTVNSSSAGTYQLGCGCYENNKIVSDTGDLTDPTSQTKLLASTQAGPVIVKLSFEVQGGRGCACCNLLDKLEVI